MKKPFLIVWTFLKEAKGELQKVSWLSRKETTNFTAVVIGLSLVSAAFIGGWDYIFTFLVNKFIL
ncbi:preprotein translocase subunit SecE [bacterium]|nr:MAG: preprotein translocase subunit SecE [bacterium]